MVERVHTLEVPDLDLQVPLRRLEGLVPEKLGDVGDVYAVSTPAKMLASFLSTLGMLFPAIVIARLVGLAGNQK